MLSLRKSLLLVLLFNLITCHKRPSHKEEMGFMIPRLVKCQKCGWKYADCELGPIPESSKSKWTCTDCISFWNVPKWGGIETIPEGDKIIHNTCALDSFLATLISQHRLDPRLFEKIGTASLFEKYLRSMLMDGNIDQVKDELIKKIFSNKIDKKGRYDMWASECEILDRLFEYSSKLLFNLKYRTCSERKKLTRCHFETQKKGDSMKQVVYDSILGQSDCQSCQGSRQILNVTSTAWFIPVDISLQKESPSRCDEALFAVCGAMLSTRISVCFLFKHQTVVPETSRLKLSKVHCIRFTYNGYVTAVRI
ncbi:hypothetical protein PRIPAC_89843 [Pristionchus pacificus]|uniref:Uncharacterized protein n=1 Tax=Pristionchus pacificus TaxID=54126 RepID=A0A2A6CX15_PRIPA|nr:hypothetical protein PRIPAC_89843 [Pristionchus pacificus]|eukprot:PDM82573.1 hypothetical protein PRIPAC_36966 [Pristionchus pacificus]